MYWRLYRDVCKDCTCNCLLERRIQFIRNVYNFLSKYICEYGRNTTHFIRVHGGRTFTQLILCVIFSLSMSSTSKQNIYSNIIYIQQNNLLTKILKVNVLVMGGQCLLLCKWPHHYTKKKTTLQLYPQIPCNVQFSHKVKI